MAIITNVRSVSMVYLDIACFMLLVSQRFYTRYVVWLFLVFLWVESTLCVVHECCSYQQDTQDLYSCVKNDDWLDSNDRAADHSSNVAIVTFTTPQTVSYAAYALAINKAYARRFGYVFRVFDLENTGSFGDPRWVKIRLLKEAISQWAHSYTYIVWLDSDLAVIDHSFRLEDIALSNPSADIIMSKDMATAPFVSNSGAIIVKNTPWSLNLLDLWWSSYDRDRCCDQNAFTWLYERNFPADIQAKTALLPSNALNSDFPAWTNQEDSDRFLHLAGLTSIYRGIVFSTGYHLLCREEAAGRAPPKQLGLTSDFLFRTMRTMNAWRLDEVSALLRKTRHCFSRTPPPAVLPALIEEDRACADLAREMRGQLEDTLKVDTDEPSHYTSADQELVARIQRKEQLLRKWIARALLGQAEGHFLVTNSGTTAESVSLSLFIDNNVPAVEQSRVLGQILEAVGAAFEAHLARSRNRVSALPSEVILTPTQTTPAEDESHAGERSKRLLFMLDDGYSGNDTVDEPLLLLACLRMADGVLSSALPLTATVRGSFLYHRFKTLQFLASIPVGGNLSSIYHLSSAVDSWQQMVELDYFGGGGGQYVRADPDKELTAVLSQLALLHCIEGNHNAGVPLFLQSLELQRRMLDGYQRIRIATLDNALVALQTLADTAINAATCFLSSEICSELSRTLLVQYFRDLPSNPQFILLEPQRRKVFADYMYQLNSRCAKVSKRLKRIRNKVT